ncbi:cyclic nucleotide-binding protein [Halothece sp. PCC 7418]|uniref:sigma 54-interacting transcriptional regulator n=1 Tax=Halothece sp. (strain PCC 7418) TaxID=65093 RepID=UPI0002A07F30|nr:sigma 54-interacting transcriptional regulator [Halothece sp. PCC 7418]AFZ44217.1 cyclic nucleotide-binding protein [Halothece sp. PCC 7418]
MSVPKLVTWLQERTALTILPEKVLSAIAPFLQQRTTGANQTLVQAQTQPLGLYILESGKAESEETSKVSSSVSLLPGSIINLQSLILDQPTRETVITQSECRFWFIKSDKMRELIGQYPEIAQVFSQQLAEELASVSSQLSFEQERAYILRPYLVTKARRGIIGRSRYAVRLRQQIKQASENRESVIIFGEPGLGKDNAAALIHFGSSDRREPIIQVDCSTLQASGAELFGRANGKFGLLEALGKGTLILNNIQEIDPELLGAIAQLLKDHTYIPVPRINEPPPAPKTSQARIILISEKTIPELDGWVKRRIKVPPLRVRKSDIGDQVNYYISLVCRRKGLTKPKVTPEAIRRLQAYDFPNNLTELENLIRRAIVQLPAGQALTEEIVWPSQSKKKQLRLNLLNTFPRFRRFLRSPWWPDRLNYWFVLPAFTLVVAILFLGPQTRSENFALNLFWAWWWPGILIAFPFVGRLWCAVCPFMIYGELTQKISLWLFPRELKRWPRQSAERWGGWFLFGLFALILLWEELWNLEDTAYLSACLLLLITAGAIIFSLLFERRFWCRYLCPIGGMNGMFAKLSMTELRAQQGTCSAECTTYQCYKGGPEKGEGQETMGCPLYSHPAQLEDNRDCVLCMTCLKACPHRSVEVNLRPPGIELWTTHQPRPYEVALLFLLLDVVFLHRLPDIQAHLGLNWNLDNFWLHFAISVALLSLPALIPLFAQVTMGLLHQLKTFLDPKKIQLKPLPFVESAYGYLPLVLGANLAHYLDLGLGEGGRLIPVALATFGFNGEGFPIAVAHPAVINFLQGVALFVGSLLAVILTQKIQRSSLWSLLPQHLAILTLSVLFWQLIV